MVVESLIALTALAGQTVVAAASTDAWDACKRGFARLLGRGDPKKEQLAEQRLEETRQQLAGTDSDQVRAAQAAEWKTRLADLLQENPDAEADLLLATSLFGDLAATLREHRPARLAEHCGYFRRLGEVRSAAPPPPCRAAGSANGP
jgi:hypothetical protein